MEKVYLIENEINILLLVKKYKNYIHDYFNRIKNQIR